MQPEKIILLPPTHEQTTPSFHVEGSLADSFIAFLESNKLSAWQPPERLEKKGPDEHRLVEVTMEAGTPVKRLEELMKEFLSKDENKDTS